MSLSPTAPPRVGQQGSAPPARLRDLCLRYEDLAETAVRLAAAFQREDTDEVLALAIRARHLRDAVVRAKAALGDLPQTLAPDQLELVARLAAARVRARPGTELLEAWWRRPRPSPDALLTSPIGVVAFAEAMLPPIWNLDDDLVVLVGTGLEAVAEVLVRAGQQRMVAFLPEPAPSEPYPGAVEVVHSLPELSQTLRGFSAPAPSRMITRMLSGSGVDQETHDRIAECARDCLRELRVFRNTVDTFADKWVLQTLDNLPALASLPSIEALRHSFAGVPMIVVAPGPSLAANVAALARCKDKALVVALSHSLRALAAAGVVPDLVLTVDSSDLRYHFADYPIHEVGAMISGVTVHPDLYRLPVPLHFTAGANSGIDSWVCEVLGEDILLSGGGSVATSALALGVKWRSDPILFVGLDLSFSDGRYYASTGCDSELEVGSSAEGSTLTFRGFSPELRRIYTGNQFQAPRSQPLYRLRGFHGGEVPTTQMFAMYHAWFEDVAGSLEGRTRLLNCTEGGAFIEGMEHLSLDRAIRRELDPRPRLAIRDRLAAAADSVDLAARRSALLGRTEAMLAALRQVIGLARRCAELAPGSAHDRDRSRRLVRAERKLRRALRGVPFLSMLRQAEIDRARQLAGHASSGDELEAGSRELHLAIAESGSRVLPALEDAVARIRDLGR